MGGCGARREGGEMDMSPEAWTILAVGAALGSLVWRMLRSLRHDMERQFDEVGKKFDDVGRNFNEVAENFRDMRSRLDRLADDHHGLARELSELRGELRGRFEERTRPAPG